VPLVRCGFSLRRRKLEPAGHSFHAVHEKPILEARQRKQRKAQTQGAEDGGSGEEAEGPADASWRRKRKEGGEKRGALKLSPHLVGVDLYALLEVSETSSAEQIKKQYRKLALQHHPDKHGGGAKNNDSAPAEKGGLSEKDMLFVKIQEAYDILSDQTRRRQYDSTLEVDDSIPDEAEVVSADFYEILAPVFKRNARWSTRQPVPEIGSQSTDIAKVHKFYDFWFNFDSWRDFSVHDEYNLDDAEFREERRWMDRQNQKVRKKYQDAERRRLIRLAELSEKLDPRIRAEKEAREAKKREEKERRAKLKQDEEDARRRVVEEKKRKEDEERAAREEKERLEKEMGKQQKQVAKGLRQRLKKCVQSRCKITTLELESVQDMCLALEAEALEALCSRVEEAKEADAAIRAELKDWQQRKAAELEEQERQRQETRRKEEQKANAAKNAAAASAAGSAWVADELGLLAKALQKFPGGMGGRWGLIANFLCSNGFHRTEPEVIAKTKELSEGQSLRSMGARISAESTGLQQPKAKPTAKAAPAAKTTPNVTAGAVEQAASIAEWTAEQQKCLEAALQTHPASLDKNERWRLIAEDVPGKTKGQCVERFKYLREQVAKQQKKG